MNSNRRISSILLRFVSFSIFVLIGWYAFTYEEHRRSFHFACRVGEISVVRTKLARHPELLEIRSPMGLTPLHSAAMSGQREIITELLERGADPLARFNLGPNDGGDDVTALHAVMRCDKPGLITIPIVEMLINHGVPLNAKTSSGLTAYDVAISNRNHTAAEYLHKIGANKGIEIP